MQYLAILAYLKTGGHVTAEMATGEGKSRTMMLAVACQFAMSKTVDFVTSDMQLAQRDYLEYQAFFKVIGAKTSLIYSTSPFSAYEEGGINFSDAANLSLFRNKAKSSKLFAKVIAKDPRKRALVLDEADRTYFDISETKFNYSDLPKDSKLKEMEWIYPFLIRFFSQKDKNLSQKIYKLYAEDVDGCNQAFIDFLMAQPEFKEEMLLQLKSLALSQFENWQDAAVTALNLKLGEDYTIEPNVLVETSKGPKLASEARLIYGSRISRSSKYSFGVHQCLHAYLNEELQNPNSPTSLKAKSLMKAEGKAAFAVLPFHIHSEKQIVYSSTSKSFLDDYKEGDVWAITGTAGSIIEREEAIGLYSKSGASLSTMKFITIPRRTELKREDKPIRIVKNFSKRVEAILEYILEARAKNRPALVICENDKEAGELNEALQSLSKTKAAIPGEAWLFVDSATTGAKEKEIIANAGNPGMITIATTRLGRGTDIKLHENSKKAGGLRVISSFLPRERDQAQIFGRGGRYDDEGDARIVVDREQLFRFFGTKKLKSKLFLSTEFFIKYSQSEADKQAQIERLLRQSLSDFRVKITDSFFNFYDNLPPGDQDLSKKMVDHWSHCTKHIDHIWSQIWPDIQELLKNPKIDIKAINTKLQQFKIDAEEPWKDLQKNLGSALGPIENLNLSPESENLLKYLTPKRRYSLSDRTKVYKTYDKALDGRAVIYDELFMELKSWWAGERLLFANIRAWWEGHGILFANTRALLEGHRPLFANLRAWMQKDRQAKVDLQENCKTIEEALANHDQESLKYFIQEQSALEFIGPEKSALDLSYKVKMVEAILGYAHKIYENEAKISNEDLDVMKELLAMVKDSKFTEIETKLEKISNNFFGPSLRKEVKQVVEENKLKLN